MRRVFQGAVFLGAALLLGGCGGRLFGVNLAIVGERTALERQVIGTYAELGTELEAYASVRAVDTDGTLNPRPATTPSQTAALRALQNRQYNRDDLDELLRAGVVGEGHDGRVVALVAPIPPVSRITPELIARVVAEENQDRTVILTRLMETTPGIRPEDEPEVVRIFAALNQELAPAGSLVEPREGQWVER